MDNRYLCLDTSILIAFLRNQEPGATSLAKAIQQYSCGVTSITSYELLFGVYRASKEVGENALLGSMTIWDFDANAARTAARLHSELISANRNIGVNDVLIASICLVHALPLLTLNKKHFERVDSLAVYTPDTLPLSA